ncbi:bifunctional Archease domain superfamily/Archease/Archease domain [Babesia duncani]|uniref:Bifunctional Archease domain superfamily/Archease/Archease domain n=1 Tax=Babesia duncani TaxID=323732 RepID=A0AAD9UPP2_9APIC|nr:bifunctional Archease domain superfamily/Archease/Archease domain [Babesia duncani]
MVHFDYELNGIEISSNPPRARNRKIRSSPIEFNNAVPSFLIKEANDSFHENELINIEKENYSFTYLDHPADVILAGKGTSISKAFQSVAVALFSYMTDLELVELKHKREINIVAADLHLLLFHFLDECLYLYSGNDYFIARHVKITDEINILDKRFGNDSFELNCIVYGDFYDPEKHSNGTEIKAITMHELKIEYWINTACYLYRNDDTFIEEIKKAMQCKNSDSVTYEYKVYALVDI